MPNTEENLDVLDLADIRLIIKDSEIVVNCSDFVYENVRSLMLILADQTGLPIVFTSEHQRRIFESEQLALAPLALAKFYISHVITINLDVLQINPANTEVIAIRLQRYLEKMHNYTVRIYGKGYLV